MTRAWLHRSRKAPLAGVCAGIARAYNLDERIVRAIAVVLALASAGTAAIAYLGLWFFVPLEPDDRGVVDVVPAAATSERYGAAASANGGAAGMAGPRAAGGRASGVFDPGAFDLGAFDPAHPSCRVPGAFGDVGVRTHHEQLPLGARVGMAAGMLAIFAVVIWVGMPLFPGACWWQFWPLLLILSGVLVIIVPMKGASNETALHLGGAVLVLLGGGLTPTTIRMIDWSTWVHTFMALWPMILAAAALFWAGLTRPSTPAMFSGVVVFGMFVVAGLLVYYVPGTLSEVDFTPYGGGVFSLLSEELRWRI
ncbi:PspC domain-containing protein [Eggerthellaceae bacterium zg-1084]|uniref:PspC domain-containing protein n=1 Tax=Berryella wangjianweii TaxID=2734634 RepID=A0A6M8J779_9ACTN|nr:PspC domain-containing protein [Berryella wangjianweii]NPD31636.1 PspC domain-containing protein [Berryella wangjianweii]QKF07746.1 PspC domain-containing protein [Berryella wangjianweii]